MAWYIFAGFAFVVGILFILCFRSPKGQTSISKAEAADIDGSSPDGFVN